MPDAAEQSVRRHLHADPDRWRPLGAALPRRTQAARRALDHLIRTGVVHTDTQRMLGRDVTVCRLAPDAIDADLLADVAGEQIGRLMAEITEVQRSLDTAREDLKASLTPLVRQTLAGAGGEDIVEAANAVSGRARRVAALEADLARARTGLGALRRRVAS